jgi:hypothetical protein
LRFAPVTDYSALDAWHSLPSTDCSASGISHPMLITDFTRHSAL